MNTVGMFKAPDWFQSDILKSLDCAEQYEVISSFGSTICSQFVSLKEVFQNAKCDELFFLFQWYNGFFIHILNAVINFCETDCIIKINIRQLYCQHDIQYYYLETHTVYRTWRVNHFFELRKTWREEIYHDWETPVSCKLIY